MADRTISANAKRARQLFSAGAFGGHLVAVFVVPLLLLVRGPEAGLSGLVAALGVLAFMGLGHWVQLMFADAPPRTLMMAWFASYVIRVGLPLIALVAISANAERFAGMDRTAVAITAIAIVVGWLTAEIWMFTRLRIPVFDPPADESQ